MLAGLVGLIPHCVSSVLITQLYAAGQLSLGGVVAGLCTGAGVGLAVLLRANKNAKQNLFIVALLYGIGVAAGLGLQPVCIAKSKSTPPHGGVFRRAGKRQGKAVRHTISANCRNDMADRLWYNMSGW
ncbi:MAG: putative manganese transporter [Ruthenibacterium lactatiformans]